MRNSRTFAAHLSTNVEELRSVERLRVALLDDEDLVVDLLLPQVVVDVIKELLELDCAIPVGNDDGG